MKRRQVSASDLQGLVQASTNQQVIKGTPRTRDPLFPLMTTPVNEKILVYIPKTNVISSETGETMDMLHSHQHAMRQGKGFTNVRCISGLAGNPLYDALGYDGSCPACDALPETWELYNHKMKAEAIRLGLDPDADNKEAMKSFSTGVLGERAIRESEEFVTFPIVIIPANGFVLAENAKAESKTVYVQWRKDRYDKLIGKALDAMPRNPGHPGGMFFMWDFTYDTGGKQANAMDSGRNLTITAITDGETVAGYEEVRLNAEEIAKDFTVLKAAEVVVASEFMYAEDLKKEVDIAMKATRETLALIASNGGAQGVGAIGAPQAGSNPLANFGAPTGNLGEQAPTEGTPVGVGVGTPPPTFGN